MSANVLVDPNSKTSRYILLYYGNRYVFLHYADLIHFLDDEVGKNCYTLNVTYAADWL